MSVIYWVVESYCDIPAGECSVPATEATKGYRLVLKLAALRAATFETQRMQVGRAAVEVVWFPDLGSADCANECG